MLAMLMGILAGCTSDDRTDSVPASGRFADGSANADTAAILKDDLGRDVRLQHPVRRIVSLAPNLTEIIYAAGAGSLLAGVTTSCDYPPPVDTLPAVSALPLNAEGVAALEPDLVLATDQVNSPRLVDMMESIGTPVYFFTFGSVSDILDAVRRVGRLAGTSSAAESAADSLQGILDTLRAQAAAREHRPSVLLLIGDRTLYSFGAESYVQDVIRAAGGRSVTSDISREAPTLSDEFVLRERPDVIIGAWGRSYDTDQLLEHHPTWRSLPAAQNDRIYSMPPSPILRPGPRVVEAARIMRDMLYPQ